MKQTLAKTELFAQSMSRKDFLKFIMLGAMAVLGLNNYMNFLNSRVNPEQRVEVNQSSTGRGFGSSRFGV